MSLSRDRRRGLKPGDKILVLAEVEHEYGDGSCDISIGIEGVNVPVSAAAVFPMTTVNGNKKPAPPPPPPPPDIVTVPPEVRYRHIYEGSRLVATLCYDPLTGDVGYAFVHPDDQPVKAEGRRRSLACSRDTRRNIPVDEFEDMYSDQTVRRCRKAAEAFATAPLKEGDRCMSKFSGCIYTVDDSTGYTHNIMTKAGLLIAREGVKRVP